MTLSLKYSQIPSWSTVSGKTRSNTNSFRPCGTSTAKLVGVVTWTMERWNRCGINSYPGSVGFNGGRTRTAIRQVSCLGPEYLSIGIQFGGAIVAAEPVVRARYLGWIHFKGDGDIPTLTAVFPSSSEARLPPCRLLILMRLLLRGVRITALIGRGAGPVGDAGGETVISPYCYHTGWRHTVEGYEPVMEGVLFNDRKICSHERRDGGRIKSVSGGYQYSPLIFFFFLSGNIYWTLHCVAIRKLLLQHQRTCKNQTIPTKVLNKQYK